VAFDYFEAMRIPVVAGRSFTEAELRMPRPPLVINDVAARAIFGAEHPVGRRVLLGGRPREVIGVVKGTRDVQLDLPATPQYYEPGLFGDSQILVRVAGDPERFVDALRAELLAADSRLMVRSVRPLDDVVADHLFERRMIGRLLAGFAATAFILAIAGLYGVTHAGASQRRLEFGIRAALGARPADLLRLVLRQALSLALLGIGLGVAAALLLGGVLRSLLVETSPADPASIAGAVVVLLLVSIAAVLGPARRAAGADPVQALRAL
jgi:putative ABC transport system permease protein